MCPYKIRQDDEQGGRGVGCEGVRVCGGRGVGVSYRMGLLGPPCSRLNGL